MLIIRDNKGIPYASFTNHSDGYNLYAKLTKELKDSYSLCVVDIEYPVFWLWTWDINNPQDPTKKEIKIVDANGVDQFVKTIKRDRQWEKAEDDKNGDGVYFYLGIIWEDGIAYLLRQESGMPVEPYTLHEMFDHEHVWGSILEELKSKGIRRTLVNRGTGLSFYKQFKHRKRKFKRLLNLSRSNKLPVGGEKRLNRVMHWLSKRLPKYKKIYAE